MPTRRVVQLLRTNNIIVVDPTTPRIKDLLTNELSYVENKFLRGKEKFSAREAGLPTIQQILWQCYDEDHRGRLATSFGFEERIKRRLAAEGYEVKTKWATRDNRQLAEQRAETVYRPVWRNIDALLKSGFEFLYKQRKALELIATHENGRIGCPPGWGKGTLIMLACKLFPKAKIDVVTDRCAVVLQRLYPELAGNLPSVGIRGCKKNISNRRVMLFNADSLHHCRPDADFVFVDEGHEACADKFSTELGRYIHARMWAFSATWDMRLDNKDMRGEAMFGPVRLNVPVKTATDKGVVLPVEVRYRDVIMDVDPASGLEDEEKKRAAYWTNTYRNKLIAKDARSYDDETQVLITCDTVEHALHLKKLLPEFKLVYAGQSIKPRQWKRFREEELIDDDFKVMTDERRERITRRFESGRYKKAIATTVWNVGVNFKNLEVLIRADGGSSPTSDTQIPGRTMRRHVIKKKSGKIVKMMGILHDYNDVFNDGCGQRSSNRFRSYRKNGWKVKKVKRKKSKLRKAMAWGD